MRRRAVHAAVNRKLSRTFRRPRAGRGVKHVEKLFWSGIEVATSEDHNRMYGRFGRSDIVSWRFEVSSDLSSVRITSDEEAADGIWTLAEASATGASKEQIRSMARKMRRLARRKYDGD